jgi:NAD(P)H dehydrogenase (quinone)
MRATIIYAHPNPGSFNAAILQIIQETLAAASVAYEVRDLYTLGFDPVFTGAELGAIFSGQGPFDDVKEEQRHIARADMVIFIYPIWWFTAPAILKGYIDRVFTNGFAFTYTPDGPLPLMQGKKAFVVQTGGNTPEAYAAYNLVDVPQGIMERGTLQFTGFAPKVKTLLNVQAVAQQERQQMLKEVAEDLTRFIRLPQTVQ